MNARELWAGLSPLWRGVLVIAFALVVALAFDRCAGWRERRETERVLAEVAEKDKQIDAQQRQIDTLTGVVQSKDAEIQQRDETIAALEAVAKEQDTRVQSSGKAYRKARRGGGAPRTDDLDERLRKLYPE